MTTNTHGVDEVQSALRAEGIRFELWQTEGPGHATTLAHRAVLEGYKVVIAAGGDGTLHEVARGLTNTDVVMAPLPLGSIMNLARALWVPRDLPGAARTIKGGRVLAMDISRVGPHDFLEAAGVGVGAVNIANGPYVGAAVAVAPEARLDDGLLDVTIVEHDSLPHLLMHIALRTGGRSAHAAPDMRIVRTPWVRVSVGQGERPLRLHADGDPVGYTPATFEVLPAALKVIVGEPSATGIRPWALPKS
jgi:diacylglycerol kinase family enzyme